MLVCAFSLLPARIQTMYVQLMGFSSLGDGNIDFSLRAIETLSYGISPTGVPTLLWDFPTQSPTKFFTLLLRFSLFEG